MNKEVTKKDEDKLEKMMKEMKIQLLQEVRENNSYRNTGYRNNREVICYKCEKKGHYAQNCQEEETQKMKCYICGSKNHLARECNNRENQRDNTRNNQCWPLAGQKMAKIYTYKILKIVTNKIYNI